jgi:hypothetical protein
MAPQCGSEAREEVTGAIQQFSALFLGREMLVTAASDPGA